MRWIISPRPANVPVSGFVTGDWIARFEARSLDDIRALGRNSPADERAFAAVARLSEVNPSLYRTWMQPFVRALASQPMADVTKALDPLRLSYTMFADGSDQPFNRYFARRPRLLEFSRMQIVVNKTFDEIVAGDSASAERTLQPGDIRAWSAAFGEADTLEEPGASHAAAGIVRPC